MTWSGSWSRWRPAQPERRGSAIAAAIALTVRAHASASMQARQPQARFAPQGMLGAEGATRQGVSAPPPSFGSDRTAQTRASAPPRRNRRLREGQRAFRSSPDLGCPRSPTMLLDRDWLGPRKSRSVRRWLVLASVECNWLRVFISKRREIPNDGFSYRPAASIPPRPRLARRLRAGGRSRFEPHGGQRQILRFFPRDSAMGGHSGGARPVAARNGAPIRRNAVRRRESFSGG